MTESPRRFFVTGTGFSSSSSLDSLSDAVTLAAGGSSSSSDSSSSDDSVLGEISSAEGGGRALTGEAGAGLAALAPRDFFFLS